MLVTLKSASIISALCFATLGHSENYLTIGDDAPGLNGVTWLKGNPKGSFERGKVYVVEFWATWCGPCKENIPHLTELASKFAGQVSIAGIDIWETMDKRDTDYQSRVSSFVTKEGAQMNYIVGVDDAKSDTANAWMKAAGEGGIPESFVIGKDGKIAWIGHAQGLAEVVPQVLAGTYDVVAARARRATDVELVRPVKEAMDAKNFGKALELIQSITAKHPNMSRYYQYDTYTSYAHTDLAKTKEMTEQVLKDSNEEIGAYQMMCSVYASDPDLSAQAYRYGFELIKKALAKKDREYMFLSMAGGVCMKLKDRDGALRYDEEAVAAAEKDSHAPKPFVEFLKRNLQEIQANKAG
jgi:thiol-disulfide isomerase/thioredoxin